MSSRSPSRPALSLHLFLDSYSSRLRWCFSFAPPCLRRHPSTNYCTPTSILSSHSSTIFALASHFFSLVTKLNAAMSSCSYFDQPNPCASEYLAPPFQFSQQSSIREPTLSLTHDQPREAQSTPRTSVSIAQSASNCGPTWE